MRTYIENNYNLKLRITGNAIANYEKKNYK